MLTSIVPSTSEVESGCLETSHLSEGIAILRREGFLVIENVIDPSHLEHLNHRYLADWESFRGTGRKWWGGGSILGHYNSTPPTYPDCIFPDILANDIFHQLASAYLGHDVIHTHYTCNLNVAGSHRQSFHADDSIKNNDYLIMNIPLISVDEKNGSMEVVPRTQNEPFSQRSLKSRLATVAPKRVNMRAGSVLIRPASLWHRGTANPSRNPRLMLGLMFYAANSATIGKLNPIGLPLEAKRLFDKKRVLANFSGNGQPAGFFPNYFAPNQVKSIIKELCFYLSPSACEAVKRMMEKAPIPPPTVDESARARESHPRKQASG